MPTGHEIAFEAYGLPMVVGASSANLLPRIERVLPPGWRRTEAEQGEQHFTLLTQDGISYWVQHDGGAVSGSSDLDVALDVLAAQVRAYLALRAPELIFVHAGVVAHRGRAIVIPGLSFSGKSTLVAALVRAGATYYSDEYAVLDAQGSAHPYAKPLSLRNGGLSQEHHGVETLGGVAGDDPVPVGLVAVTRYRPGGTWQPRRISVGEGILALVANTVPAQERPAETMAACRRAVESAIVLEGERGDATVVAEQLLASLSP